MLTEMVTVVSMVLLDVDHPRMMNSGGSDPSVTPSDNGGILIHMDEAGAGTGTGVSWPMGDGGDDPVGGTGNPADGDVLVTATVRDGVFNVSVVDDSTGKNLGNVVISSGDNNGTIKIHYSGGGHGTSLHVTLDNAGNDNNISISAIRVPHYTYVPQSVVSRVCNGKSYRYGFNGQMKVNEIAGKGNHNTALFGELDTRTGTRWNLDPKPNGRESQYATFGNNPIFRSDVLLDSPSAMKPASAYNYGVNKENANSTKIKDDLKYIFQFGGTGPFQRWKDISNRDRDAETGTNNTQTQDVADVAEFGANVAGVGATRKFAGGAYKSLERKAGQIERNHMPSMNAYTRAGAKISKQNASAIEMIFEEHRAFISTGGGKAAEAFRKAEGELLSQGKYIDAFDLNANRIRSTYGDKYNIQLSKRDPCILKK
ncbi:hypothetical protein CJD36_010965 [Flavipsychrobacter stenotrophus]|uniref:Uncharacterized protein n=1 Tax=Flavipsychrobacter stenotrophus TaxID=2077091 RepID=A0A2S7SU98_9BACT|nr:hypothetical protein [Flavipsychrobacter stenotrophus]PQJ10489.1 hypothetical protein CJD36_010965 [Flavipsychrobacter stenotrophus]